MCCVGRAHCVVIYRVSGVFTLTFIDQLALHTGTNLFNPRGTICLPFLSE